MFPILPPDLKNWEAKGGGVYVVVNSGGHKDKEITHCRAVFYEHDDLDKTLSRDLWRQLNLPSPTFQVDTGNKSVHSYWVFDKPVPPNQWKALQVDLLDFAKGDQSLKNPSRVMRLAGFLHPQTKQPAQIIVQDRQRYSFNELRASVPPQYSTWPKFSKASILPLPEAVPLEVCLSRESRSLIDSGVIEGRRNTTGAKVARDLIGTADYLNNLGQLFKGDPRSLFEEYAEHCNPPLPESERERIWRSAERTNPSPSLSHKQIEGCIKGWAWRKHCEIAITAPAGAHSQQLLDLNESELVSPLSSEPPKLANKYWAVQALLGERLAYNELTNQIELDGKVVEDPAGIRLVLGGTNKSTGHEVKGLPV
ncbi:hypothetical protein C7293_20600 [filamentous cyanobacterium CCT1]|nr:hypothetical protein C7293_20600 [filamentous cyanobacterium CCT1]PSN76423.1 hypothetical protein C8B47_27415 [filamentous cyanobacterium CCP4]